MKILVCDDEKIIIEQITDMISSRFSNYSVVGVQSIKELLDIHNINEFDVVFLDIILKNESGIDLGLYLSKKTPDTKIIFISGYQNKVSEIFFSVYPFGFIDKPICSEILYKYLDAVKDEKEKLEAYFTYSEKGKDRKLRYSDICYIESNREKLFVNTLDSCFYVWKKISEVEDEFPDYFVRCHKSYLVNMRYVLEYKKQVFKLMNGKEICISRSKKNETEVKYFKFKGGFI
ncbi:MAG: response regulator transcription factor [Clostridia bacterium]|nr:response regulator transcription factor [Clostridia bacterium]